MDQWLIDLLALYPDTGNPAQRARMMIAFRWPSPYLDAAQSAARAGDPSGLARYDAEVVAISVAAGG